MGGGHEGHEKFVCPDWKQYKVEGIKELEYVQKKLAEKGLKDPWLRNEVWRYHPDNYPGHIKNCLSLFGRGLKWAVPAMALTIAIDQFLGISKSKPEGHWH